jgi:hypothetical protein
MKRFIQWLRVKLGIVQIEKELSGIYRTVNRLDKNITGVANAARIHKRPQRYDQINRTRKRRKKGPYKVADVF